MADTFRVLRKTERALYVSGSPVSTAVLAPEQRIRQWYAWFEEAEKLGKMAPACRRLGIWWKTFHERPQRFAEVVARSSG